MNDKAQMLFQWREQRLKLKDNYTKEGLQNVFDWFKSLNPSPHGFNYDDTRTWPDIWQYISDGYYTRSGNGLGLFYTIVHTFPEKEPELWLIHDLLHTDMYLIAIVDGYVLNRDSGEVELLADVQSDLHILTKHTKEEVMTAVKWNNE